MRWDYIAKIVMIGDSACGKSSLTVRLTDDTFSTAHDVTIAAEIGSKIVEVGDGKHIKLQIWDTAGQEHFRSITRSYFRNATGCLLVYDVGNRQSFDHAQGWLDDIREQAHPEISICLVGNKSDISQDARQVSTAEAAKWASDNNIDQFVETSAKTGDNVVKAYAKVAQDIYEKIASKKLDVDSKSTGIKANHTNGLVNLNYDSESPQRQAGRCC